jgi:mannose/fructose/N-acetylgalactosamine-specific phosphotransferase system component IID
MDAISMMKTAAVLLAIAAAGGLVMAVIRFRGADRPPSWITMLHGFLAGAALTLLIYAWATMGLPTLAKAAVGLFVVVALVGAWINLNFHSKLLPLPKGPVVVHGIVAVITFVILLLAIRAPQ